MGKASDVIELWEERAVRIADLPFTVLLTRIGLPVSRKKKFCRQRLSGKTRLFPVKHRLHTIGREIMMPLASWHSKKMCLIAQVSKTDEKTKNQKRNREFTHHMAQPQPVKCYWGQIRFSDWLDQILRHFLP